MTIQYSRPGFPGQGGEPAADSAASIADRLMAITVGAFRAADVDIPGRRIIYFSPIPVDCEQVAVLVAQWTPTPGWEGFRVCATYEWMLTVTVAVSRLTGAVPKGRQAPTPDAMTDAFRVASRDMDVLRDVMAAAGPVGPEAVIIPGVPSGGIQTVELRLQIPGVGGV